MNEEEPILAVKNIKKYFKLDKKTVIKAVDDISFHIHKGEFMGLIGESGSGKSTVGKVIMHMHKPTSGQVYFKGMCISDEKVYKQHKKEIQRKIQFVFQDSASAMNYRMKIGEIIAEPLVINKLVKNNKERDEKIKELMELVELDIGYMNSHPYELSGGQRQRAGIARALALEPEILIADEPIASLDVTIQAQIVNLFKKLQKTRGLTCLFIAHDLAMIKYVSDRVAVMNKGKIMETGIVDEVYDNPQDDYTRKLIDSIPSLDV